MLLCSCSVGKFNLAVRLTPTHEKVWGRVCDDLDGAVLVNTTPGRARRFWWACERVKVTSTRTWTQTLLPPPMMATRCLLRALEFPPGKWQRHLLEAYAKPGPISHCENKSVGKPNNQTGRNHVKMCLFPSAASVYGVWTTTRFIWNIHTH